MKVAYRALIDDEMVYDVTPLFNGTVITRMQGFSPALAEYKQASDVMEHFGKLDDDGVRIFEKDIVMGVTLAKKEKLAVVVWDNQYCCYHLLIINDDKSLLSLPYNTIMLKVKKVFGNIYENKELINDSILERISKHTED